MRFYLCYYVIILVGHTVVLTVARFSCEGGHCVVYHIVLAVKVVTVWFII